MGQPMRIIKASAGSGKTFNLAKTYIKYLIGKPNGNGKYEIVPGRRNYHEHLLAITFTNAATDEMKQRIVKELGMVSEGRGQFYDDFKTEFVDDIAEVQKAAGQALSDILFNYSMFNVSTIDSFFQRILRSFAYDLDKDSGYELQLDEKLALQSSVRDFFLSLGRGANGQVNDWVQRFIEEKIQGGNDWNVFRLGGDTFSREDDNLEKYAENINKEVFRKNNDAIVAYMSDMGSGKGVSAIARFQKAVAEAKKKWEDNFPKSQEELKDFAVSSGLIDALSGNKSVKIRINKGIIRVNEVKDTTFNTLKQVTIDNIDKQFKSGKESEFSGSDKEKLVELTQNIIKSYDYYVFCKGLLKGIGNFGILGQIMRHLEDYRRDNNLLLISDTTELIKRVIDSGVPFMYERTGTWINNYLIDEFQDTSEMQYDNFRELLSDSVSEGKESLIIGDEKQSIYRFRNSNPDLLRVRIEQDFPQYCKVETLKSNWRTFPAVVNFNNELFMKLREMKEAEFPKLRSTYANIEQKAEKTNAKGYVRLVFIGGKGDDEKGLKDAEFENLVLDKLVDEINGIKKRGFGDGDIAILVNKHYEGDMVVETLLRYNEQCSTEEERINVVSGESLLLKNSPSVKIIISVLRYVESCRAGFNEEEEDAAVNKRLLADQRFYKLLRVFERNVKNTEGARDYGKILTDSISEVGTAVQTQDTYMTSIKEYLPDPKSEMLTLGNVVDKIMKTLVIDKNGKESQETEYLLALQDLVNDFESKGSGTLREFLRYWDQKKDSLAVSSSAGANAVRVMTIHKSKGLEFPCVILPFVNWKMINSKEFTIWVKREDWIEKVKGVIDIADECDVPPIVPVSSNAASLVESFASLKATEQESSLIDNMNKTYVAMTRPKQELHAFMLAKNAGGSGKMIFDCLNSMGKTLAESELTIQTDEGESEKVKVHEFETGAATEKFEEKSADNDVVIKELMPMLTGDVMSADKVKVQLPTGESARLRGERLHALFSRINCASDKERALRFCLSRGYLTKEGVVKWSEKLADIFADEKTRDWFAEDNKVLNERTVIKGIDGKDRNKRPDRVVIRPDGHAIVVDYKFGGEERYEYIAQVREYAQRIHAALDCDVEGYVWYVEKGKIVNVAEVK